MEGFGIRRGPLKLKGDKHKISKTRKSRNESVDKKNIATINVSDEDEEGWTDVETLDDLSGPVMLLTRDNKIIQFSESSLTKENEIKAVETEYGSELKPSNVGQVLLARRLGAIDGPYALKTSFGKYLSPNTIGSVEARREAVGPSEEWTPALIIDENSPTNCFFSLCSYTGHHLGYYETEKEFFRLRADSINAGPSETFRVRCQRTIRNKQRRMAREEELRARGSYSVLSADMEAEHLNRLGYHAHSRAKNMKVSSPTDLKAAQEEGRLYEHLLDKRSKSKHDPFC